MTPCKLWTRGKSGSGYGRAYHNGKPIDAHRLAWIQAYGPIPDGLFVCHHCDVKLCYEPTHLFLGTNQDNQLDNVRKGNHRFVTYRGADNANAKLSQDDVVAIRQDMRSSRVIANDYGVSHTTVLCVKRNKSYIEKEQSDRTGTH